MSIIVCKPGDYRLDDGSEGRLYPIEENSDDSVIMYDDYPQPIAHVQANIVALFSQWFLSFFDPEYFKFTRIKTTVPFREFKTFMKEIYKKEMPLLIIDPSSIEVVDDSLFSTNMLNRYNAVDPISDNISAKDIYSLHLMETDRFRLKFRRIRYRFTFDTMIMERTMNRQLNTYNMLLTNIRHNSKFMLPRISLNLIPKKHIINIANFHDLDYKSDEFLTFLNTISDYPIIRRVLPNGLLMFYVQMNINLQVETPNFPSKDSPEMSDAIEIAARIVDSFNIIADLPSEYILMTTPEYCTKFDHSIPDDPENIGFISPYYADMDWPDTVGDYHLANRTDVELQETDTPSINIVELLKGYDPISYAMIYAISTTDTVKLSDILLVRVYKNGTYNMIASELSQDGTVTLINPEYNTLYSINVYLNTLALNNIKENANKEFIGTVEKY